MFFNAYFSFFSTSTSTSTSTTTTTTTTFLSLLYNATTSSVLLQTAPSFRSRSSNQLAEPNCSINEFCLNNTSIGEHYVRRNRNPREFTAIQASEEMFGDVRWEVGFQVVIVIGLSPSYPMPRCRCAPCPPPHCPHCQHRRGRCCRRTFHWRLGERIGLRESLASPVRHLYSHSQRPSQKNRGSKIKKDQRDQRRAIYRI